jgi:hypothetical protein
MESSEGIGINDIIIGSICGAVEKAPLTLLIYPGLNGWRCARIVPVV